METMVKCNKEFKEQTLLLSDEIGMKKAAGNQLSHDCRLEEGEKRRKKRIASDKTALNERELAMQREIQELKKARLNCGNQIMLPQFNVKFP